LTPKACGQDRNAQIIIIITVAAAMDIGYSLFPRRRFSRFPVRGTMIAGSNIRFASLLSSVQTLLCWFYVKTSSHTFVATFAGRALFYPGLDLPAGLAMVATKVWLVSLYFQPLTSLDWGEFRTMIRVSSGRKAQ